MTEGILVGYDQRISSCDVWLKALSQDMGDRVAEMLSQADKKAAKVMQGVEDIDKALVALDVANRLQALETGLGPAILEHIEGSLNRDLSRSIEAMAKTAVESTDGAAMGRITALAIKSEGHDSDLKAIGLALEGIRQDGQRLQDAVKVMYDEGGRATCPCTSGKCPCKCNREASSDPFQANCPWGGGFRAAAPTVHPMSPNAPPTAGHGPSGVGAGTGPNAAPTANHGPFGVGSGLGAGL